jgi:hypothetical protein
MCGFGPVRVGLPRGVIRGEIGILLVGMWQGHGWVINTCWEGVDPRVGKLLIGAGGNEWQSVQFLKLFQDTNNGSL